MSTTSASLQSLERSRRAIIRRITNIQAVVAHAFAQSPSDTVVHQINASLDQWKDDLKNLEEVNDDIFENTDFSGKTEKQIHDIEDAAADQINKLHMAFVEAKGKLGVINENLRRTKEPLPSRQSMNLSFANEGMLQNPLVKLPDIPVPKFDGNVKNFTEWFALFGEMIDGNAALQPVQKLYFLKQAMVGDAKNLLRDITLQEEMYPVAFQYVKDRYYNKRAIIANHFSELVNLPIISAATLRESLDKLNAIIRGLRVCELDTEKMSPLITYLTVTKLPDDQLRMEWENSNHDFSTYPSFPSLNTFLQNRCFAYEGIKVEQSNRQSTQQLKQRSSAAESSKFSAKFNGKFSEKLDKSNVHATVVKDRAAPHPPSPCRLCHGEHYLSNCTQFIEKSIPDRRNVAEEKRLCLNCLRPGHVAAVCRSSRCRECGRTHHTLLHTNSSSSSQANVRKPEEKKSTTGEAKTSLALAKCQGCVILLPTAVVNVDTPAKLVRARVLLDNCSQANLVTQSFVKKNRLVTRPSRTIIASVSSNSIAAASVTLTLTSRFNSFSLDLVADVVDEIPYRTSISSLHYISSAFNIPLAECKDVSHGSVDLLVGAEFVSKILLGNKKFYDSLCLEESHFGWVAQGPLESNDNSHDVCCNLTVRSNDILTKFWEVEEVVAPKIKLTEYELCETHFRDTFTRLPDGRFQVRLPLKRDVSLLANTYTQARSALLRAKSRYDESLRKDYVQFMVEYRSLQHMELSSTSVAKYFIPHLPVFRPDSTTTKMRVVFNASAKNKSGISLNEALLTGPTLQPDLFETLIHFRSYVVAFSADVSKMYRRIAVHPEDRPLQSILWRDNKSEEMQVYQLTTLTYGTSSASFIAARCLAEIANNQQLVHPGESKAIANEFYMDDLLTGSATVEEAMRKQTIIHQALEEAGFPLRKYVSNSEELLAQLDSSLKEELRPVRFSSSGSVKILGLQWLPCSDDFSIKVKLENLQGKVLTKRLVSSLAARLFDPLGFAAPLTIRAKLLLQDLWLEGRGWDDEISVETASKFRAYYNDLHLLSDFTLPRAYFTEKNATYQVFGFCDASMRAYGAAVYLRVIQSNRVSSILVCAKSRVAPTKQLTIPRLELCGAALLAQLVDRVCRKLSLDTSSVTAFTDSTVVLGWLRGSSDRYQVFVRNRVEFVTAVVKSENWHYVGTAENPADLVTRGVIARVLVNSSLWAKGPKWLAQKTLVFPAEPMSNASELPELRSEKVQSSLVTSFSYDESLIIRYSNLDKLLRVIVRVLKFIRRPSTSEHAMIFVCKLSQLVFFQVQIMNLRNDDQKCAPLASLEPFLDDNGLLRVGGRLSKTQLSFNARHPVILHRQSSLALLIVKQAHEKYFHASRSFVLAFVQSKYWIHGGLSRLVKKVLHDCVWCVRMKAETLNQVMGDLPLERASASRPFAVTGVDFAGPFTVKCTNHRSLKHVKHYAAFFVCLATRAIHIEVVSDLTTIAFLAAFQRFIARRGIPNKVWSDNATNFVGAVNVLTKYCQDLGVTWSFITARSPHQGGLWEAAVKAGKKHLLAATHGYVINIEQLSTILTQVEAILNSRPLYRKSPTNNSDEIDAITPGHFLVGSHLLQSAQPETFEVSLSDRLDWSRNIIRSFWRSWKTSYLAQLQSRTKWKTSQPNLAVGDIVLIKDDQSPPARWPLALVTEVHPDAHGRVRIVSLKTSKSNFCYSVQRLVKLPFQSTS